MSKNLEIDYQYELYLKRMALDESKMHEVQKTETKRAFYAGATQILAVMCVDIACIEDFNRAVVTIDDLVIQCEQFWKEQH